MSEAIERPKPDRIEGWPLPEEQAEWLGEAGAEATLRRAYESGRMHHAWLIGGLEGIGKATLAYRLARFVLAHPDPACLAGAPPGLALPPDDPVFRRVAAGAHPDLLALQRSWDERNKRFRTVLSVDDMRRTIPFFGSTPAEGGWRIAIVDTADDMNPSSANAILKVLEEPPRRALFLILAETPSSVLPTIRSRCRLLMLPPLPPAVVANALAGEAGEEGDGEGEGGGAGEMRDADRLLAATLAGGSLRRAILLLRAGGLDIYRAFAALTARLPEIDVEAMHAFADRVTRRGDAEPFSTFLDLLRGWLDRRVRREPEPGPAVRLAAAVEAAPLARWAEVWEKAGALSADAEEFNLDRKQVVLSVLMTLARATRM